LGLKIGGFAKKKHQCQQFFFVLATYSQKDALKNKSDKVMWFLKFLVTII
jgi:hypothetical protein